MQTVKADSCLQEDEVFPDDGTSPNLSRTPASILNAFHVGTPLFLQSMNKLDQDPGRCTCIDFMLKLCELLLHVCGMVAGLVS